MGQVVVTLDSYFGDSINITKIVIETKYINKSNKHGRDDDSRSFVCSFQSFVSIRELIC